VASYESGEYADNRIRIRIGSGLDTEHTLLTVGNRESQRNSSDVLQQDFIKQESTGGKSILVNESVEELATLLDYEPLSSPKSKPSEQIQNIEVINQLLNEKQGSESSPSGLWLINWIDGKDRGILSFPVFDASKFPLQSETKMDVVIKIRVSPEGEVFSAELVPPGSGDTRIDRYLHSVALQLTLEPSFETDKVQEAHLRLLFVEDNL